MLRCRVVEHSLKSVRLASFTFLIFGVNACNTESMFGASLKNLKLNPNKNILKLLTANESTGFSFTEYLAIKT